MECDWYVFEVDVVVLFFYLGFDCWFEFVVVWVVVLEEFDYFDFVGWCGYWLW